ncbi:MAG: TraM recognition domain-containing protein, partial [Moraxellaceae bacterium]|nr:TraM recognition domain-containing protein [Moraxellaceae bacterium]
MQDDADRLLKIEAQLENWRQVESLNPPKNYTGFSLEKAMLENAVVYFQGSLNDEVAKTATKSFILEVIQESARLDLKRKSHLTFIIDEVRFLVSKTLADALATIVGFRVNIVTACQSINDLKTPDDINLDGEATYRSISTNSQLKLVYGGADSDTAEWVAKLSGTIVKQVTSMEKVTVKSAGAEEWDLGRTIKPLEEALITENVALTLPPRVCVVFRPFELATVTFTAPVPVKDMVALDAWLVSKSHEEKNSLDRALQEKTKKQLEKVQHIKTESAEISAEIISEVPNEPDDYNVDDTQLSYTTLQVDAPNEPDDYNVDDTQLSYTTLQVDAPNEPDDYNVDDTQLSYTTPQVDAPNEPDDYNVDDTQLSYTTPQVDAPNEPGDYNVDDTQLS